MTSLQHPLWHWGVGDGELCLQFLQHLGFSHSSSLSWAIFLLSSSVPDPLICSPHYNNKALINAKALFADSCKVTFLLLSTSQHHISFQKKTNQHWFADSLNSLLWFWDLSIRFASPGKEGKSPALQEIPVQFTHCSQPPAFPPSSPSYIQSGVYLLKS